MKTVMVIGEVLAASPSRPSAGDSEGRMLWPPPKDSGHLLQLGLVGLAHRIEALLREPDDAAGPLGRDAQQVALQRRQAFAPRSHDTTPNSGDRTKNAA